MSTPALKVVSNSPAAPPRRETLIAALERREESLTRYRTASAAVDRLRSLIEKETLSCSALAEIERKSAESASAWARGDVANSRSVPGGGNRRGPRNLAPRLAARRCSQRGYGELRG